MKNHTNGLKHFMLTELLVVLFSLLNLHAVNLAQLDGVQLFDTSIQPLKQGKCIYDLAVQGNKAQWDHSATKNYYNYLDISTSATFEGQACLLVKPGAAMKGKTQDTAWQLTSFEQKIKGHEGHPCVIEVDICSNAKLAKLLRQGYYSAISWRDTEGKQIGETLLKLEASPDGFAISRTTAEIPKGTVAFVANIGFDVPNVEIGEFFALKGLKIYEQNDAMPLEKCSFVTSPIEIGMGESVGWSATIPDGTSLCFQVSEADDKNGCPDLWSDFHGPDGSAASSFSQPFAPKKPWIRLKGVFVSKGRDYPVLHEMTFGTRRDVHWTKRDEVRPPLVEHMNAAPTFERQPVVKLRISSLAPVNWRSFHAEMDKKDITSKFTRKDDILTYTPEEPLADGLHTLQIGVESITGKRTESVKYIMIGQGPAVDKVTLRDDGVMLVNGKPFFPIGAYGVWKREFNNNNFDKAFSDLAAGGFNFAHTYNGGGDMKSFLDSAHRHGIRLWIRTANAFGEEFQRVRLNHPAILAWYTADDSFDHITPEKLRDLHDSLKAIDTNRLTAQADAVFSTGAVSRYHDYVRCSDVFMPEIYPVLADTPEDRASSVSNVIRDMKKVKMDISECPVPSSPAIWAIIQYFQGWNSWKRFPDADELRAMTYAAIVHGATGVTWYTYGGYYDEAKKQQNYGITSTPERWNAITTLAKQLNALADILTERTPAEQPKFNVLQGPATDFNGYPSISCLMKIHNGEKVIIAVNSSKADVLAEIRLDGVSTGDVLGENRTVTFKNGKMQDQFAPYAVHIYVSKQ